MTPGVASLQALWAAGVLGAIGIAATQVKGTPNSEAARTVHSILGPELEGFRA